MMHMAWPHWAALVFGLALFAINMYWSLRAFRFRWRNEELTKQINDMVAEHLMDQAPASGWARAENNDPHEQ
jgi:prophage maintenance system killer protein